MIRAVIFDMDGLMLATERYTMSPNTMAAR